MFEVHRVEPSPECTCPEGGEKIWCSNSEANNGCNRPNCIKGTCVSWEENVFWFWKLWYENGKKCYKRFELAGGCECYENWEQCPSDVRQPIMELMLSPKCFDWVASRQ